MLIRFLGVSALVFALASPPAQAKDSVGNADDAATFAAKAFVDAFSFLPTDLEGQLGKSSALFDDVESYQSFRQALENSGVLHMIAKSAAALTNEVLEKNAEAKDSGEGWTVKLKARQTFSGRNGVTDRCLDVVAGVVGSDVPDGYTFQNVIATDRPSSDCGIVDASPLDKEFAKIEFKRVSASIEAFLQTASSSLFDLAFTETSGTGRDGIRAFGNEQAYGNFKRAVDESGMKEFLRKNLMISSSEYAGNAEFVRDGRDDGLWHVAFNVRQKLYHPDMYLTRCLQVSADVRDLPPQFGGAQHAFDLVTFKPADDQTECETGKELAAAMRDLIRSGSKDDQ